MFNNNSDNNSRDLPIFTRVMFGSSHLYVFYHPQELEKAKANGTEIEEVNYEMAQEEIAQNSGVNVEKGTDKSKGNKVETG